MSYVRFGDVFVKCLRQSANDLNLRYGHELGSQVVSSVMCESLKWT